MIKNNYHTHVKYCNHAKGDVEDYVLKAIELGFNEIGITDHAPILESFMTSEEYKHNWCHENMKMDIVIEYLDKIKKCQEKYSDKIKIYSGFETEYLDEEKQFYMELRNRVDYLNVGIHYCRYNGKVLNCYSEIDYKNLEGYVDAAIKAMELGIFNTLVHPDLFMFGYKNINGERSFDDVARSASRRIIEAAIRNNVYLEINANGLKNTKKYGKDENDWLYPYYEFWQIAREYKELKIIIGSDAHNPEDLYNDNVKAVLKFAEALGIKVLEKMEINH